MLALFVLIALSGRQLEPDHLSPWILVVVVPIIIALQSLIFAALVVLGLWLYRRFSPIEVEYADDARL